MYAKKIKFTDYLGTEREQTYYFNLTKTELMRMNMLEDGRMANILQEIADAKNSKEMWTRFEKFVAASYGILSQDGIHHKKSEEITQDFMQSPAYDALVDWFLEDQTHIEEFANNVIPSDVRQAAAQQAPAPAITPIRESRVNQDKN